MSKLIVGCGYLGSRVADLWHRDGEQVFATTRTPQNAARLAARGWEPVVADVTRPDTLRRLPAAETVLIAFGYDASAGHSRMEVYARGLSNLLEALGPQTNRLIYVSSTGVYGQQHGGWVTEETPCRPDRDAGRAFLAAEQGLAEHALGSRAVVLRMAGLYGPGRVPRPRAFAAGQALAVAADSYLNLIHVDDMAQVVLAAARGARCPRLYLASDGHPVQRREYFRYLAELMGVPEPRFVEPDPRAASEARGGGSKRVSHARLQSELGVVFEWSSYREGLAALLGRGS